MSDSKPPQKTFPTDWPEGCPPSEAAPTSGEYFRVVRGAAASIEDFRSHRELGKLPKAPPCLRAGLSTFRVLDEAERMALLFPVPGSFVAQGTLDALFGVSMRTQGREPSHTTVWPFEKTDRIAPFRLVTPVRRPS